MNRLEKRRATIKDLQMELYLRDRERGNITWTTSNGSEMDIREMTDGHIMNAIKCMTEYREMTAPMRAEFENLGDQI